MLERLLDVSKLDDKASASYESWVSRRAPDNLCTNAGASILAFQGWRQFKEAFAPELVRAAITETAASLGRPVKACLDPFGGSGTTALTCQFLGVFPTTIEVNPFLAGLIAAKLSPYDFELLPALLRRITAGQVRKKFRGDPFPGATATFVEPGQKGRFIFPKDVADRLSTILKRIDNIEDLPSQRLFRVMLASTAISVSNVVVRGRRYRRNWEDALHSVEDVDDTLIRNCVQAIYDLRRFRNRALKKAKIRRPKPWRNWNGDAQRADVSSVEASSIRYDPQVPPGILSERREMLTARCKPRARPLQRRRGNLPQQKPHTRRPLHLCKQRGKTCIVSSEQQTD
jgi:hypothetical protein